MTHSMFLRFVLVLSTVGQASLMQFRQPGAVAPGDIIIGGMFPIHAGVKSDGLVKPQPPLCVSLNIGALAQSLAMVQAVEMANNSTLLKDLNITLGYRIHDSCSDVSTALLATLDLTQIHKDCGFSTSRSQCSQRVVAVVGASYSEISIAVARELNLELIPQISYASTATILSDKNRFPAFMRTVPNDNYQTKAMVKMMAERGWNWVGIIITDGDYGRSALESFSTWASESGICLAFKEILPDSLTDLSLASALNQTVDTIHNNPKVKVIVSFAKPMHMKHLFKHLLGKITSDRVWIASDSWSTSEDVVEGIDLADIGKVVGFTFKSGNITPFYQFLRSLRDSDVQRNNSFLDELYHGCNHSSKTKKLSSDTEVEKLIKYTHADAVFSVQMAVSAITYAVAGICRRINCKARTAVQPWEFLTKLRNTTFEKEGGTYKFDQNGDINLGYDISLWNMSMGKVQTINIVAVYYMQNGSFALVSQEAKESMAVLENVVSRCSDNCEPGQFKKTAEGQHTCCYECINCTENHYTNATDMDLCLACNTETEWADMGSSKCNTKTLMFFTWRDGFAVVLLTSSGLGILLVLLIAALFVWHRQSPVVKAAGGPLCYIILLSLIGSFVSAVLFVGRPSDLQCKTRQVLFGLSFTLCVSCILVKSLKILLAFQMNPELRDLLRKLFKPYVIIFICVSLQVVTCTLWLLMNSPRSRHLPLSKVILAECGEGSYTAFGVMLAYIAALALVCFGFAFKGRKLPEKYNDAKFITFGMLIYLISWVIFVPVYVTTTGKYLPAVEMVVILISNYGILSCHFFPKCYVILFKKEHNTKDAFLKNVYEYSRKSADCINKSGCPEVENNAENNLFSIFRQTFLFPNEKSQEPNLKYGSFSQSYFSASAHSSLKRRTFSI
ncbi:G-protein coupled receptor family C group 6 member A [Chanos chanos]|uniref:G-protein coupled receptor family C group 6 member A n=1 Tax=Chanos chanos TaxID=29144 RepID=A0A6J2WA10_CHACN|nr:G-protein coupled receptor family C group 6 member A [Chanos chanos]